MSATLNSTTYAATGATATEQAAGTFSLRYDAAANSYTVNDGSASQTFTAADSAGTDTNFAYYSHGSGTSQDQLTLFTPGSSNTRLALTYTSYGAWTTYNQGTSSTAANARFFVYGVQTTPSSMPTTGLATYNGIVDGAAVSGGQAYRLVGSTGSLTANFASGAVTTSLVLRGNPNVMATDVGTTSIATLTGSGSITSGTSSYTGTLTGSGMNGTLNGAFYGPGAAETGYSFATSGGGNSAIGVFVGKK